MQILTGTSLSGTVFLGKTKIVRQKYYNITHKFIDEYAVSAELDTLTDSLIALEADFQQLLSDETYSTLDKDIFQAHLMIATDPEIKAELVRLIKTEKYTAPNAVYVCFNDIINRFQQMENDFFAQRGDDYKDVGHKLLTLLLGEKAEDIYDEQDIVCIKDITPSQVSHLAKLGVKSYITEVGSAKSHSTILARALGFCTLILSPAQMANLSDAQPAIVDATTGRLILNPDPQTIASYQHLIRDLVRSREFYSCLDNLPAQTRSNRNILLKVNVELPEELAALENIQYDGIGLYRTEFIYLSRHSLPTQAEQYAIYKAILISMQGKPVTIRTFDLGGDKLPGYSHHYHEDNPNLGCRGIRFSLYQEAMFKAQLKAILQASVYGKVNIMFPMIIGLDDLLQAKTMLRLCQQELDSDHIPYDKDIRVGIMIETPSAAICSDVLATACDFFSIGTNDLVQYTLAVDRNNERVSAYYNQAHPAVLQLIKKTIQAAKQAGIAVSVCGEMASEPLYVPLLIGLGIDELSVNPVSLPLVKAIIRSCDTELDSEVQNFDFSVPAPQISAWLKALEQRYFPKP